LESSIGPLWVEHPPNCAFFAFLRVARSPYEQLGYGQEFVAGLFFAVGVRTREATEPGAQVRPAVVGAAIPSFEPRRGTVINYGLGRKTLDGAQFAWPVFFRGVRG